MKIPSDVIAGCWEWVGARVGDGYGAFKRAGKRQSAHRVAYVLVKGTIPTGLDLDHRCRNRSCVNPEHLEPVTRGENVRRGAVVGNRNGAGNTWNRGERCGTSKLTEFQVRAIRADTRAAGLVAEDYGIGTSQVYRIRRRQKWAHLD